MPTRESPREDPRADSVESIDDLAARRRLAALTREHHAFLLGLARKLCRSHFDPDDLVQDVLEKTVAHFDRLPPEVNHAAWMARVMRNLFIDRLRSRGQAQPPVALDDVVLAAPDPDELAWWERVTTDDIRAALPQLSPELRGAFERFAFERQSYKEIAEALHLPMATVGTRVLRARRKLRAILGGSDE
jgi:RNA polymerase sigma-70 factor (ECF subfamily)